MKRFSIKNFRIFGSEGTELELKPVTILTGTNSSGKSSYVKALILFSDFIHRMSEDYRKTGTFNPASYSLDFTRSDLKLKSFRNVLNNSAPKDATISIAVSFDLGFIEYTVEYSFKEGTDSKGHDSGVLDSISIHNTYESFFEAKVENGFLIPKVLKLDASVLKEFLREELLVNIPTRLLESYYSKEEEDYDSDILDSEGHPSPEKLSRTELGSQLYSLQKSFLGREELDLNLANTDNIPYWDEICYAENLIQPLSHLIDEDILFYLPVLERFRGKKKDACIRILKEDAYCCKSAELRYNPFKIRYVNSPIPSIESVISDYSNAQEDNFIDYYKRIEKDALSNFIYRERVLSPIKHIDFYKHFIEPELRYGYGFGKPSSPDSFYNAYECLSAWQWGEDEQNNEEWKAKNNEGSTIPFVEDNQYVSRSAGPFIGYVSSCKLFEAYKHFIERLLKQLMMPDDLENITYFNDSFTNVQRLHSFEEKSTLTELVSKNLELKKTVIEDVLPLPYHDDPSRYIPGSFVNRWLAILGIGKRLLIDVDEEGLGYKIKIEKNNGVIESLADLGHGITQTTSLLLLTENTIMESCIDKSDSTNSKSRNKRIVVVEEPEVSLHPSMQSMLAGLFKEASDYGIQFMIETHSEYLVRKTQSIISGMTEEEFKDNPFVVYYFNEDGTAYDLEYSSSGRFLKAFGSGFFDEASKSVLDVLNRERSDKK